MAEGSGRTIERTGAERSGAVARSRDAAVRRLSRGGAALVAGGASAGGAFLVPQVAGGLLAVGLFVGGLALAGAGALEASRSASHLWRYGHRRALWIPVATAGLGASAGLLAVTFLGGLLGLPLTPPAGVVGPALLATLGFGALLAVLTVGVLVRWMRES